MHRFLALCALACALGCAGDPLPLRDCTPGASVACACVGGAQGAQSCSAGGMLEACMCPDGSAADAGDAVTTGDAGADVRDASVGDAAVFDALVDATDSASVSDAPDALDARDAPAVCDADIQNDPANCGACGSVCGASGTSSSPHCFDGRCRPTCRAGMGDCDGNGANGCETDLRASPANCGTCGSPCTTAHATAACVAGACAVGACLAGWCDRDGDAANGCETSC